MITHDHQGRKTLQTVQLIKIWLWNKDDTNTNKYNNNNQHRHHQRNNIQHHYFHTLIIWKLHICCCFGFFCLFCFVLRQSSLKRSEHLQVWSKARWGSTPSPKPTGFASGLAVGGLVTGCGAPTPGCGAPTPGCASGPCARSRRDVLESFVCGRRRRAHCEAAVKIRASEMWLNKLKSWEMSYHFFAVANRNHPGLLF